MEDRSTRLIGPILETVGYVICLGVVAQWPQPALQHDACRLMRREITDRKEEWPCKPNDKQGETRLFEVARISTKSQQHQTEHNSAKESDALRLLEYESERC